MDFQDWEFRYHTDGAKAAIIIIRCLRDSTILEAARDRTSDAYERIRDGLDRMLGPGTNWYWIQAQCAEEAYDRGLIDEFEFDRLAR